MLSLISNQRNADEGPSESCLHTHHQFLTRLSSQSVGAKMETLELPCSTGGQEHWFNHSEDREADIYPRYPWAPAPQPDIPLLVEMCASVYKLVNSSCVHISPKLETILSISCGILHR